MMRRSAQLDSFGRLSVKLIDVTSHDDAVASEVLGHFATVCNGRAATVSQLLRNEWTRRHFGPETINNLSKWCFTARALASAQQTARVIGRMFFGTDLPRLVDKENFDLPDYLQLVSGLIPEINAAEGLIEEDWDTVVSGGGYRDQMLRRFWGYACSSYSKLEDYFDQPEVSKSRPPVFLPNRASENILSRPSGSSSPELAKLIPATKRHRWFRSMTSSQALAQSVFGNLIVTNRADILNDVVCEDGEPLLAPGALNGTLEYETTHLGEPRSTSVDAFFSGTYRVAIECKLMESDVGTCSRPRLSEKRDANFAADHCDGSYSVQRGRSSRCSLTSIGVRYWDHLPKLTNWSSEADHAKCPLESTYQLARNVLAATTSHRGVDTASGHAVLVFDSRNPSCSAGGKITEAYARLRAALKEPSLIRRCSWQRVLERIRAEPELRWLAEAVNAKYGL